MLVEFDWKELQDIAERLSQPGQGGSSAADEDIQIIDRALDQLHSAEDYECIVKLRSLFTPVIARDSIGIHKTLQRLTDEAIFAAEKIGDIKELAHLLGANGHNLHRQGLHQRALEDLTRSYQFYEQIGMSFEALKNYFMTALCHRAMGDLTAARQVLGVVISKVDPTNPWFGNPLNLLGWIERDSQHLDASEKIFRQALALHRQTEDPDILAAGTLADIGEVIGLQGRYEEAIACFEESLTLIRKYQGQYDRQEARTELKLAELLIRGRKYSQALQLLDHADDLISYSAYRDQLWKIELLRAMIKFRQGDIGGAIRRMRSAKTIYEELGLPPKDFMRQIVNRLKSGSGLSKFKLK